MTHRQYRDVLSKMTDEELDREMVTPPPKRTAFKVDNSDQIHFSDINVIGADVGFDIAGSTNVTATGVRITHEDFGLLHQRLTQFEDAVNAVQQTAHNAPERPVMVDVALTRQSSLFSLFSSMMTIASTLLGGVPM